MTGLFETLAGSIQRITETIREVGTSDKMAELSVLLSIIITLVIMYKGYEVLMGRSQSPIRELTWDIVGKLCAITFALNLGGWLDLTISAMDGLYEWAGGGMDLYKNLDEFGTYIAQINNVIWSKLNGLTDTFLAVVCMVINYISFLFLSVITFSIIVITQFTHTLLVIFAPVAFWLLVFKSTKDVFVQWLGLLLSNTLIILFIGLFIGTLMSEVNKWANYTEFSIKDGVEALGSSIILLVNCIVFGILIIVMKFFAEKVARVSMEGAMGSAMSSVLSPIGRLAGMTGGKTAGKTVNTAKAGGKLAAKGTWAGAKGSYSFAKKMYERARNAD
ncbi:type IV secretion system protein [Campylobacter jejuni]|uniref:Type IV secretion system protein n=1 Tax=Campylobacter coli TaxID=195 RepID=A0A5T0VUK3_CAMCO|nr:type IV secretion system protein [Campylobacter jejuni]EAK4720725.1 type IV secretion system protein [Campylobacter coli]EAH5876256.1 type IV secretion system protein [Campylobacter jejuni]EAH9004562.1 type IV secretion system protein [Campylobacter jejuni]EAI3186632.1 type IV secretion system protein [Campylobacter jejuni]